MVINVFNQSINWTNHSNGNHKQVIIKYIPINPMMIAIAYDYYDYYLFVSGIIQCDYYY